ncbi:type II secretion system protein [Pseudoduganella sp.]|uniref:type II secretion system protein n=1 Tax=Pseudoduganella sp. TaxID=1880898 RepID=UPI0035B255AA
MKHQRGFSLIELLAAAAIMGILAAVAVPVMETTLRREKERALRTALRDIRGAIDAYKAAVDAGRIAKVNGGTGYPPGLVDLAAGVKDLSNPSGPPVFFLRKVPRDPFHPDAKTPAASSWGLRDSASEPDAPKAGKDVFDVYSTSTREGLNGVPYSEW